MHIHTIFLH